MVKNNVAIVALVLLLTTIVSCEKDFTEVGASIIENSVFQSKDTVFEISTSTKDIDAVRADNIAIGNLGEYLLGVYANPNYKTIEASIVSQLAYSTPIKTAQSSSDDITDFGTETNIDSIYSLDKVCLRLPYPATKSSDKTATGAPIFTIDSLLGNPNVPVTLQVFQNKTFLNTLNPQAPAELNSFDSDHSYELGENLTEDLSYNFKPNPDDTLYVVDRTRFINGAPEVFKDTIKITSTTNDVALAPFLTVPLDKQKMKALFWDKFTAAEFASSDRFQNYFRGLFIKAQGEDGSLVPFNFTATNSLPTLDFYYTITRVENGSYKDTIATKYSMALNGVRNSIYTMGARQLPIEETQLKVQGTAGSSAAVEILTDQQVQELRTKNWLVNDASLTFYVDTEVDTNTSLVPRRLLLYKNVVSDSGEHQEIQLSDSYKEGASFGGVLQVDDNESPDKYTVHIIDYLKDVLQGKQELVPLTLKVFNINTDVPVTSNVLDTIVKTYNWNPRGVTLLNENSSNGAKKARLTISYTEEK